MHQQPRLSSRILAGALTFVGLALVWTAILGSLPSEEDFSAKEAPVSARPASLSTRPVPEPTLDLSIPGVPVAPPSSAGQESSRASDLPPSRMSFDRRATQVARLRCEAEVEQLCPDTPDGAGRRACLEKRAQQLPTACQQQVRERLVKWKEERSRLTAACQDDIKRYCAAARPGGGQALQCLQQYAQELSDGCYEMLPKGTVYFKQ
jgi:hypothetical protein